MASDSALSPVEIALLGPPEVLVSGRPLNVDTRKALALLAYVAVELQPQRRERLAALLWPEATEDHARGALRRTLSVLHSGLGKAGLLVERERIGIDPSASAVDVWKFERLIGSLAQHVHGPRDVCPACVAPLVEATGLCKGPFMDGFSLRDAPDFDEWQLVHQERHRSAQADALERLASAFAAGGRFGDALIAARSWLEIDPWNEAAYRRLMVLHQWTGDRIAALRQYEECVRVLARDLGVAPSEETARLRSDIAENRLAPPLGVASRWSSPHGLDVPSVSGAPLVGRSREVAEMLRGLDPEGVVGHLWMVEGEAGVGKSRLLDELDREAQRGGFMVARVQAYEGDADLPYGVVVQALRSVRQLRGDGDATPRVLGEVSRLLPEIADDHPDLPLPGHLESTGATARFFDAVDRAMFGEQSSAPVLLIVDDLHLADEPSLDLLDYLVRRMPNRPVRLAVAWRAEALGPLHPLRTLLERRVPMTRIELGALDAAAVSALVTGAGIDAERVDEFRELSGGNAFVLMEYLAAGGNESTEAPATVRSLLASRVSGLGSSAADVLAAGSVVCRPFDVELLAAIAELQEQAVIASVEELLERRLLREADRREATVEFGHTLLRDHVYGHLSSARRRRLHRRTADALASRALGAWGSDAMEIANHYRLGGRPQVAADFLALAGERAQVLAAFAEAAACFEAAMDLGHPDRSRLLELAGDVLVLAGRYGRALEHYGEAVRLGAGLDAARLERKIGEVHARLWDWRSAGYHLAKAALLLGDRGPVGERALLAAERAVAAHRGGDELAARELAADCLGLAAQADEAWVIVHAQNVLGLLAADRGDDGAAEALLERGLAAAVDHPGIEVAVLNNLALVMGRSNRAAEGVALLERALARNREVGDRHREAALRSNLADLYRQLGMDEEAIEELKLSAALFAEVGRDPGAFEPEIWRLREW